MSRVGAEMLKKYEEALEAARQQAATLYRYSSGFKCECRDGTVCERCAIRSILWQMANVKIAP